MADEEKNTEESLLLKGSKDERVSLTWEVFTEEVKRMVYVAGPMVTVLLSQYLLLIICVMMVGHLGELYLSSTSIASSLCSVTGFSFLTGLAGALETLGGQAYGAQQYRKLGILTQTAIFCSTVACIPICVSWIYMEKILVFVGQDPLIAHEAAEYIRWIIPALFCCAILQPLIRYFQAQSLIMPMLVSSLATFCIHIPLCWALVFKSGLKNIGGALAMCISNWLNTMFLLLYMKYSPACAKTRAPISVELFHGIGEFFRFAVPSAIMTCLEYWSCELLVLLSGLLPNPQLETSVLAVCLSTSSTLFVIPYGFGAAASTRISNELGAGRPQAARIAVYVVMILVTIETTITSSVLLASRHVFGYIFSNEKKVVDYVTIMTPLVCLTIIFDSLQAGLSGVVRGCGWQDVGAYVNLAAYYLCGVPVAVLLGFWAQLRGVGLWVGIQVGCFLQVVLLSIFTSCTNWETQASKARERIFEGCSSVDN